MTPRISVLTSVYNGEKYINECIDSILNQTFSDFEYIILNDGSTDQTKDIIDKYTDPRLRIFHQQNLGIPKSLNKGVSLCHTDLIAHLDGDDYAYSNWLERQFEFMVQNQSMVFCSARFQELFKDNFYPQSFPFVESDHEIRKSMCYMNCVPHSFATIRKNAFLEIGGYDQNLVVAHDYDLWIRLLGQGNGHVLDKTLGVFRIHEASISKKKERLMIRESFQVQWKAYQKLGGSFWKMVKSLSRRGF
ncbi:MAG: glycosyltransferase, partial [Nitrospina sp.]|nr:glycosyltransferase [Nitrospina sp.]